MKRRLWWFIIASMFVTIITLSWRPLAVQADYTIKNYDVHVDVAKDGSAEVSQEINYLFGDDYHGVYNVQDLHGIQGAQFEGVATRLNGGMTETARSTQNEANNTYQLTQTKKQFRVKLYRAVSAGDELRVAYRYRLLGVITNYQDTAELNWKIIGTGWDEPLKKVRLTIQLPAKNIKQLQAWTHGPLTGHTQVDKRNGRVTMTLPSNPENSFVESHLLFPTSVTATNQRTSSKKRLVAAQKQEAALAKAANAKRRRQSLIGKVLYGLAIVALVVTVLGYWWWLRRHPANSHQRPIPINHSFDVPTVQPAVAQSLWRTASPDTRALSAEILQAAADKELTLEPILGKRKPTVKLTKLAPITNSFLAHCFDKVAVRDELRLDQLKKFGEKDTKGRLNKWFTQWQHTIDEAVAAYQDQTNYRLRHIWLGFGVATTIISLLATLVGLLISPLLALITGIVVAILTGLIWLLAIVNYRKITINTDEGLALVNQITGFRQMLKDIGHFNTAEIGDLVLWEQILPYAAAFGLAEPVANKLAIDFGTATLAAGIGIYYPIFFANDGFDFDLSGTLSDSFSGALDASSGASSPAGGSGGFSGGSSGGFGGGSGGGAF
ncbi:DUF2207 domain-containing protein [Lactiplantibacillus sp. WILCCON 0030]|uniref:DUF2207 domain-containing protein n=1 Tax=Lactiplantibacillus brownii TaxID=3069269 RepID=A0ABU1AD20_9LACO|nr:DUF2207 domain-containing protein [Lactiplantibacillus brownii]MDQ7938210.1 DUF2207 domain-containing protein [Lactiplantibacillus brownii]